MKKSFLRSVALITLSLASLSSVAVTKDEMEQARTIAAKTYLRWANDASGYLDGVQAKTLDQLKSQLKPKELENLKAFNKVQVPTDYASWDKDKLVHFWSVTFFNSPELSADGKRGKSRVGAQISKMTISAPAPKETPAAAPAEEKKPETQQPAQQPADATTAPATPEAPTADAAIANAEEDTLSAPEPRKRESSNTAVYVAILAVLVAVVVALVVYAVNSMKESGKSPAPGKGREPEDKPAASSISASVNALESELAAVKAERDAWRRRAEKAEKALTEARDSESRVRREAEEQTRRAEAEARERIKRHEEEDARRREQEAAKAAEALRAAQMRREEEERKAEELRKAEEARKAEELRQAEEALREAEERRAAALAAQKAASADRIKEAPAAKRPARTIYLGRVNAHGIFVRADRQPVVGHSFFALTTTDGMSGSFSVIDNPEVFESALADPETNLANACTGHNLLDTLGATEIITDQSGTAIFEGGCWRVARKARIAYE